MTGHRRLKNFYNYENYFHLTDNRWYETPCVWCPIVPTVSEVILFTCYSGEETQETENTSCSVELSRELPRHSDRRSTIAGDGFYHTIHQSSGSLSNGYMCNFFGQEKCSYRRMCRAELEMRFVIYAGRALRRLTDIGV